MPYPKRLPKRLRFHEAVSVRLHYEEFISVYKVYINRELIDRILT
jgi:hypothetical protein